MFGDMSSLVIKYQTALHESNVCWKQSFVREKKRPQHCSAGTTFDGSNWCNVVDTSLLETSVARKGGSKRTGSKPMCSPDDGFELKGAWCYKPCPSGTAKSGWGHTRCKTTCHGAYPEGSPLGLCGKSFGALTSAVLEMTVSSFRVVIESAVLIAQNDWAGAIPG